MPNWLVIAIVLIAVVPGALVILGGVVAMFLMPSDAGGGELRTADFGSRIRKDEVADDASQSAVEDAGHAVT